jgi:GTP cyclohydrolase I/GTP cyclohydrolase-4
MVSVDVTGITACPCAQHLVEAAARTRLLDSTLSASQIEEVFAAVPVATHNQRGTGTLTVGTDNHVATIDVFEMADVIRDSMSARTRELLKRYDERDVVEAAHESPRFVEDCVRGMLSTACSGGLSLDDSDFVWARQVNHESIHAHDVEASRGGTVSSIRSEIAGGRRGRSEIATTPASWLQLS